MSDISPRAIQSNKQTNLSCTTLQNNDKSEITSHDWFLLQNTPQIRTYGSETAENRKQYTSIYRLYTLVYIFSFFCPLFLPCSGSQSPDEGHSWPSRKSRWWDPPCRPFSQSETKAPKNDKRKKTTPRQKKDVDSFSFSNCVSLSTLVNAQTIILTQPKYYFTLMIKL